jgi:hypothetical protein
MLANSRDCKTQFEKQKACSSHMYIYKYCFLSHADDENIDYT